MPDQSHINLFDESIYKGRSEEHPYFSEITEVIVGPRTTDLKVSYEMPEQSEHGILRIWSGMVPDTTRAPILEESLPDHKGSIKLSTPATNFNKGAYIITVSAGESIMSIAATTTLLNGQPIVSSGSFIAVTAKASKYISTIFSNPTNMTAIRDSDWAIIYEGIELGKGKQLAKGYAPLDDTSGMLTVNFEEGTLEAGKTYNVCLSVGPHVSTISAAYIFKYLLL